MKTLALIANGLLLLFAFLMFAENGLPASEEIVVVFFVFAAPITSILVIARPSKVSQASQAEYNEPSTAQLARLVVRSKLNDMISEEEVSKTQEN